MNFDRLFDAFNMAIDPKGTRGQILEEMTDGKRPFHAETVRRYTEKGYRPGYRGNLPVLRMAVERQFNDIAEKMLNQGIVDLSLENRVDLKGQPRYYGGHVFLRPLTDGEILLKAAVDTGNTGMIRELHTHGVPADIKIQDPGREEQFYIFRDLWKAGPSSHIGETMPVLRELYPDEISGHQFNEYAEAQANSQTIKAAVIPHLYL